MVSIIIRLAFKNVRFFTSSFIEQYLVIFNVLAVMLRTEYTMINEADMVPTIDLKLNVERRRQ